ncbi:MAG TPA: glycosyltransferase [Candidatus Nanoarchaeia archaeon]|nr:glycosyltransferase [Candidatus Nanoarchaeia archaeon]
MKIAFISRVNLESTRTNVYNFSKTCEAINATKGFQTVFVTTDQKKDTTAFFDRMGIHAPFEVVTLAATDTTNSRGGSMWHEIIAFSSANLHLAEYLFKKRKEIDAVYFRDESLFLVAHFARGFLNKKVFFEIHSVYEKKLRQFKNTFSVWVSNGVVAISSGLKRHYQRINKNIIVSLCSAAEESWFDHSKSKEEFRKELHLPLDTYIIGYIGVVGINPNNDYYEIDDVIRSLKSLSKDTLFVIGGELNQNGEWLRTVAKEAGVSDRVLILPWMERKMVSKYLQAFDVHVIPKRKKDLVGDSPAKMFPSLASKRPIVAGRAESIQEVLTDGYDAHIVKTNEPHGWAQALSEVRENSALTETIVRGAEITKTKYTWEKRGENIGDFIKNTNA